MRPPAHHAILCVLLFLLLQPLSLAAQWRAAPRDGVYINLPAGWKIHEAGIEKVSATNGAEEVFFLLRFYDTGLFDSAAALDSRVRSDLGTSGRGGSFLFARRDAVFGEVSFSQAGAAYRGYLLSIEDYGTDLSAVAFCSAGAFEAYTDMILSVLDSLSVGHSGIMQPGAVSSFRSPYPSERTELHRIEFEDRIVPVVLGSREPSLSQQLIEREARLLALYGDSDYAVEAWKRYYRLLYRDLYARTAPLYAALRQHVFDGKESDAEIARRLLAWLQGFEYRRLATMSDCLSPLEAALTQVGDCDSRGLLYVILLHHFDIDAVLMVSSRYAHSVAAVDVKGPGARFPYAGKRYLVAETTDDVEIGLIDREMSNTEAWIGIDFMHFHGSAVPR